MEVAAPVTIPAVADVVKGETALLGAQNCADQESGAYTGEVSAKMLAEAALKCAQADEPLDCGP